MHWPTNLPRVCCHQDVDLAYQDFCNVIRTAAKNSIPRGCRNNHILCWDAECENPYRTFLQSPEGSYSNGAAIALFLRLDKKRRDCWSEAVQTIDLSHSSRKAWGILNNLTGRSRRSPCQCDVLANVIASQLIRNGRYESIDLESSRLICQEVSDLWRVTPTSPVNISESFTSQEFAAALKHLKPGKVPGPDSIFPELITHAGAALKSWLCGILSSCLHHLKTPKVLRRALVVAIPKPKKPVEDPKSYRLISSLCVPYKILEGSYTLVLSRLLTHFSLGRRLDSNGEGQPCIKLFCLPKTLRIHLRPRARLVPCFRFDSCLRHCLAPWSHLPVA